MKAITDWINSHKVLTVCIALFLLVVQPFLVHVVLLIPAPYNFMVTTLGDGELLTYVAGFEAFLGTVFLGVVAVRQNDKANEINQSLLAIEITRDKYTRRPCLALVKIETEQFHGSDIDEEQKLKLILTLANMSETHAEIQVEYLVIYISNEHHPKREQHINERYCVLPSEIIVQEIISNANIFFSKTITRCELYITLRNRMKEETYELIPFSIFNSRNSYSCVIDPIRFLQHPYR